MSTQLDKPLQFLVDQATLQGLIDKVILYGSRARGDAQLKSDYDIAVLAPRMTDDSWVRWSLEIKEKYSMSDVQNRGSSVQNFLKILANLERSVASFP